MQFISEVARLEIEVKSLSITGSLAGVKSLYTPKTDPGKRLTTCL